MLGSPIPNIIILYFHNSMILLFLLYRSLISSNLFFQQHGTLISFFKMFIAEILKETLYVYYDYEYNNSCIITA
jgi:hypothetical protein